MIKLGGRDTDVVLLDENGKRSDGRTVNETRKVMIKAGVLKNANGSAYIEFGDNKILAGVYGPRDVHPKHLSNPDTGILIAAENPDEKMEPASLSKLLTAYIIFREIRRGNLTPDEEVVISENAWRTGGSRMFIEPGERISVELASHQTVLEDVGLLLRPVTDSND